LNTFNHNNVYSDTGLREVSIRNANWKSVFGPMGYIIKDMEGGIWYNGILMVNGLAKKIHFKINIIMMMKRYLEFIKEAQE
jgi:hypothetical protein